MRLQNLELKNKIISIRGYLFLSALIVLNICLYAFAEMSFVGYWSDRVIFWLWLLSTPFVIFSFWKKPLSKIYFGLLLLALFLSIIPMGLPFFAIFFSGTGSGRRNHFSLENHIRAQVVSYGILGTPRLQIVKDGLLFDKIKYEHRDEIKKNDSTWLQLRDAINAELVNETDTCITIKYYFEKDTADVKHLLKNNP